MRRILYVLTVISTVVLLVSCSHKDSSKEKVSNKRDVSSKIDTDLVESLIGDWVGDESSSYKTAGNYKLSASDRYVYFDEMKLQITDTIDNMVYTQTIEDQPFYYDFRITDNKLDVLPSYPVPKEMVGGSLAPLALVRQKVSTDSTLQSSSKEIATSETTKKESNSTASSLKPNDQPPLE